MSTDPLDFEDDVIPETANDAPAEEAEEPAFDPAIAEEARKYGWKAPEEWQGDPPPNGFMDPADYLTKPAVRLKKAEEKLEAQERTLSERQKEFEERISRLDRMNQTTLERQKKAHEAELARIRSEQRQAAELGDLDRYDALSKQHDELAGQKFDDDAPKPQYQEPEAIKAFKEEHAWILGDSRVAKMVSDIGAEVAANGGGPEKQAEVAAMELRRLFPERYKPQQRPRPQRVDGGGLAGASRGRVDKLPPEAREQMKRDLSDGLYANEKEWAAVYYGDDDA